jgi:hypothetical protein
MNQTTSPLVLETKKKKKTPSKWPRILTPAVKEKLD